MKREWLEKAQDGLIIILNHLLFIAAAITVLDMFQAESPKMFLWISTLIIPFFFYQMTKRPQKLLPPPFFIILLGILSMIEKIMRINDWEMYYFVIVFVYLAGYFLYFFSKQYLQFLSLNENSAANIPEQEIFRNGIKQTLVFGAGSFIVLIMTANIDWLKKIADQIWNWIMDILRYIFAGLETPVEQEVPMEEVQEMASDMGGAVTGIVFPEIVQDIVIAIVTCFVFIAFIMGCLLMFLIIYQFLKEYLMPYQRKKNKKELQSNEDVREYCGIEKKSQRRESVFSFWNNREKIRRLYQKKVLKRKQELIGEKEQQQLEYLTAKECCDKLSEQNLKMMYEKARYSAEDVTAEDVKWAKTR